MKTTSLGFPTFAIPLFAFVSLAPLHAVDLINTWSVLQQSTTNTASDSGNRVAKDASGNVVVFGTTNDGTADYAFLQKRSAATGSLLWEKKFAGQPGDLVIDSSGNAIITGGTASTSSNIYSAKYASADGTLLWSRNYDGPAGSFDLGTRIALDASDNVAITGLSMNASSNYDFYTAKYAAADGAIIWERRYDTGSDDQPQAVVFDSVGNVVVAGYVYSPATGTDYYTAKYAAATGAVVWERRINSSGSDYDSLLAMKVDGSDNVVVTGGSGADILTMRYAAATGATQWSARYVDASGIAQGNALAIDSSGNVFVGGLNGANGFDIVVVKYNAAGAQQWAKTVNGTAGGFDNLYGVSLDSSGNPIVVGQITNTGSTDIYSAKYASTDGAVQWLRIYDGPAHGNDIGYGISANANGTVAMSGPSGSNRLDDDVYVTLLNTSSGSPVWEQTFGGDFISTDAVIVTRTDASGNVFTAGRRNDGSPFSSSGNINFIVTKRSGVTGALLWEQSYDSPSHGDDILKGMVLDASGNPIVAAESAPPAGGFSPDFYTVKYDGSTGTVLWSRRYDSPANSYDLASGLGLDSAGNVFVGGSVYDGDQYNWYIAKYEAATGAILWEKTFNGTGNSYDELLALTVDSAGDVIVGGYTGVSGGFQDLHVKKYSNASGTLLWTRSVIPASGYGRVTKLTIDPADNVCVTGTHYTSSNGEDIYTAKFAAATGAVLWQTNYNGPGNSDDTANAICADAGGNVFVTGGSKNAGGNFDYYTVKYAAATGSMLWERRYNGTAASDDIAYAMQLDSTGNVFVSGASLNASSSDIYSALYASADGSILWDARRGTAGRYDVAASLAVDGDNNLVLGGGSWSSFDTYYGGTGEGDLLVVKYVSNGPDIAVEQPVNTGVSDGGSRSFGNVIINNNTSLAFTIRNTGTQDLTGLSITIDGADASLFTVTALPTAPVVPGGSTTFTVRFAPLTTGSKTADLHIASNDPNENPFDITLNGIATTAPPTITDITNQTINEDNSTGALAFTIGDADTPLGSLTVSAESNNQDLVSNAHLVLGGTGANRTLTVTPESNAYGNATITVIVDDGSNIAFDTFILTVNAVNDPPTISDIADQSTLENTSTGAIAFTIGDIDSAVGTLTVGGSSSNTTLVPNGNLVFSGSSASRTVTITPNANVSGTTTLTVSVSDGSLTSSDTFVLTVTAPEIAVEQPSGTSINTGGTKGFGGVVTGSTASLVFTIKNTGNAPLTGLAITKDGTDAALFTITANPTAPVSGGGSTTFTVQFAPIVAGQRTATLHIANNDDNENPFDIVLTGNGLVTTSQWRQQYFGTTSTSGPFADNADFDFDGIANLIEYAFGLNPTANSAGQLPPTQKIGNTLRVTFTEPPGITGIIYGAEWSTSPGGPWTPVTDTGTPPQHQFIAVTGASPTAFMRLKVTPSP